MALPHVASAGLARSAAYEETLYFLQVRELPWAVLCH
jgi:hypothetical protein